MGPVLVLVWPCFRENEIVTCKIVCLFVFVLFCFVFLLVSVLCVGVVCVCGGGGCVCGGVCVCACGFDTFLLKKNKYFLFLEIKFKNGAHLKKGLLLTYFSHFLVTRERTQKFLQHISHLHTFTYFAYPIDCLPNFAKFGVTPSVDSFWRHFGAINK